MRVEEIIEKIRPELEKTINYLKGEILKIRTSRPTASLVEGLEVDILGKKFTLKSLGMISLSGAREIIIQPWDDSYLEPIERAITKSPLQVSPLLEKDRIRIRFPSLNEDMRRSLVRLLAQKSEEARKTVRHWRREAWREIQDGFAKGEITEDEKYRGKDKLQELIDEYNKRIDEMIERKKKEIME